MLLIVGLGNPERKYFKTYHNIGFLTVDRLADKLGLEFTKTGCQAVFAKDKNHDIILAKPTTYMNLSGNSIQAFKSKFKLKNSDILVIVDDIDIPKGTFRFRESGSAGTHNGLRSIVSCIGSDFARLRIGIKPEEKPYDLADYVLSEIEDKELFNKVLDNATDFIIDKVQNES